MVGAVLVGGGVGWFEVCQLDNLLEVCDISLRRVSDAEDLVTATMDAIFPPSPPSPVSVGLSTHTHNTTMTTHHDHHMT